MDKKLNLNFLNQEYIWTQRNKFNKFLDNEDLNNSYN